jgi:signal transduction histidine kinase
MKLIRAIPVQILFLIAVTMSTLLLYFVFDLHLSRMTEEALHGWMRAEDVNIQEGQLLSAFSKNQRMLASSEIIKGMTLISVDRDEPYRTIEFGDHLPDEILRKVQKSSGNFQILTLGPFHKLGFARLEGPQKFIAIFETRSTFFATIFALTALIFLALFGLLVFLVRKMEAKQMSYAKLAAKVAHDIRSPINTLNLLSSSKDLSTETNQDLLKKTIERLQGIVGDLIENRKDGFQQGPALALPVEPTVEWQQKIKSLIEEKRALCSHLKDVRISLEILSGGQFPLGSIDNLVRSLSNLLDNSIEAIGFSGVVSLKIQNCEDQVQFVIEDTGSGVPAEIVDQIGRSQFSFGKTNGSGMGVYSAKTYAEELGGIFNFESKLGQGTKVTFSLPANPSISGRVKYLVIDDDPLVHKVWQVVISESEKCTAAEFRFFQAPEQLKAWLATNGTGGTHLFADYDLGSTKDGLEIIKCVGMEKYSTLVTNSFDDPRVARAAAKVGVKVYSKDNMNQALVDLGN